MHSIVLLLENSAYASWTIFDASGKRIRPVQCTPLSIIKAHTQKKNIILCLYANTANQFITTIPSTDPKKLTEAIPHALSDRVAQKISEIQFSYTQLSQDRQLVTVISKKILSNSLELLAAAGIVPNKIYTNNMLIHTQKDHWLLLIQEKEILLKTNIAHTYCFEAHAFLFILEKILADQPKPKQCQIILMTSFNLAPWLAELNKHCVVYEIDDHTQQSDQHYLDKLIPNVTQLPEWHLLASEGVIQKKFQISRNSLYASFGLLFIVLCYIVFRSGLNYQYLSHKHKQTENSITSLTQPLYPGQRYAQAELKQKIQQDLKKNAMHTHKRHLEVLDSLSNILKNLPKPIKVHAINYEGKHLQILIEYTDLIELKAYLRKTGYPVKKLSETGSLSEWLLSL